MVLVNDQRTSAYCKCDCDICFTVNAVSFWHRNIATRQIVENNWFGNKNQLLSELFLCFLSNFTLLSIQ